MAEAAQVIENIQRDLNIDLSNELANFFNRMGSHPQAMFAATGIK